MGSPPGRAFRCIFPGKDAAAIPEPFAVSVQVLAFAKAWTLKTQNQRIIPASLVHHAPFYSAG